MQKSIISAEKENSTTICIMLSPINLETSPSPLCGKNTTPETIVITKTIIKESSINDFITINLDITVYIEGENGLCTTLINPLPYSIMENSATKAPTKSMILSE